MRKLFALVQRELLAYFSSPLAYVVLTAFLFIQRVRLLPDRRVPQQPAGPGDGAPEADVRRHDLLLALPAVRRAGDHDAPARRGAPDRHPRGAASTSPISEGQVVVGKFLAAFVFYLFLGCRRGVRRDPREPREDRLRPRLGGVPRDRAARLVVPLRGPAHLGPARNQIIAAILAFAVLVVIFSLGRWRTW